MNRRTVLRNVGAVSAVGLTGCTSQSLLGSSEDNGEYTAEPITTEGDGDLTSGEILADGNILHHGIGYYFDGTYYGVVGKAENLHRRYDLTNVDVVFQFYHDKIKIGKGYSSVSELRPEEVWKYRIPNENSEKEITSVEFGYSAAI